MPIQWLIESSGDKSTTLSRISHCQSDRQLATLLLAPGVSQEKPQQCIDSPSDENLKSSFCGVSLADSTVTLLKWNGASNRLPNP